MLLNDGNVGIGTTSPSDKLHVAGGILVETGATGCVKDADGTVIASIGEVSTRLSKVEPKQYFWRKDEFPNKGFGTEQQII